MSENKENTNKKLSKEERTAARQQKVINFLIKHFKIHILIYLTLKPVEKSEDDISKDLYGNFPLIQSKEKIDRTLLNVGELNSSLAETKLWVRGRLFVSRSTTSNK